MSGRIVAGLSPLVVLVTMASVVAPANAQSLANPFATTPAPALPPAQPFSTPGLTPAWDPYAAPGFSTPAPTPVAPTTPYGAGPYGTPQSPAYPYQDWASKSVKLIQNVSVRTSWLDSGGGNGFGMTNVDLSAGMAFPFFGNTNLAPLILTPGFNFHMLQGPRYAPPQDLPGIVYDVFL